MTGILLSGDLIDNDFRIGNEAKIILAPEPATLIALWDFDGTYATTNDNHSYDLVPGGGVTFVPGLRGQALKFHGGTYNISDYSAMDRADTIIQPTNASLNSPLSIMGWIKPGYITNPASAVFCHDSSSCSMNDFGLSFQVYDRLQLQVRDNQDGRLYALSPAGSIQPGQWIHVAATWDGSISGGIALYINGQPSAVSLYAIGSFQGLNGTNPLPFRIGASQGNSIQELYSFDGCIDQFSFWQGVLTPAEIFADFNTPIPELPSPPVADADGPYTIYVGDTLTLEASGSTDNDNDIVSYIWDLDDNNSFETDAGGQVVFDVNYVYLQSLGLLVDNTYNIHLKVTDSKNQSDTADSTLTIIPQPALQVAVDIKPGSCPNPVNVKSSGVLPVAILGTVDVNVTAIDPTSIRLAGVNAIRHSFEDVAGPVFDSNDCNCTEAGPDGYLDLMLKFKTQEIVDAIGDVNDGDILALELTGVLYGERPIEGGDCVLIRGRHKQLNKADFNRDGKVDMADFAAFADNWLQSSVIED